MTASKYAVLPRRQVEDTRHPATGKPVCQWEVFTLVKALKDHLRLNDRDLTVLQAHLSVLPKDLREDSPKWSFKSVTALLERANGMDDSTFNRAERRLEARGLIRRNISANGRRFPVYHPVTRTIVGAYGVDLQPLFDRVSELGSLHEQVERERIERLNLVTRISSWLGNIRRALLERIGDIPESFVEIAREMRRVTRRKELSVADLKTIQDRLHELEQSFLGEDRQSPEERAQADLPCPSETREKPGAVHQNERHIESDEKDSDRMTAGQAELRKLSGIWASCKHVNCLYDEPPGNMHALAALIHQFSRFVQVGNRMAMIALERLGPVNALIAFDYLAGRVDDLENPEGYLMSMIKAYSSGRTIAGGRLRPA